MTRLIPVNLVYTSALRGWVCTLLLCGLLFSGFTVPDRDSAADPPLTVSIDTFTAGIHCLALRMAVRAQFEPPQTDTFDQESADPIVSGMGNALRCALCKSVSGYSTIASPRVPRHQHPLSQAPPLDA